MRKPRRRPLGGCLTRGGYEREVYLEYCRQLRNEPINRRIRGYRTAIRVGNLTTDEKDRLREDIKKLKEMLD